MRLKAENVDTVVIHTTDSQYGDVPTIDQWHKEKGWDGCGYHFVISNCYAVHYSIKERRPDLVSDGRVHMGRPLSVAGAHVKGHNWHTIGIALVGKRGIFTSKQLQSAVDLCHDMQRRFPSVTSIKGHVELDDGKTCPDLDMDLFRWWVEGGWRDV